MLSDIRGTDLDLYRRWTVYVVTTHTLTEARFGEMLLRFIVYINVSKVVRSVQSEMEQEISCIEPVIWLGLKC